MLNSIVYSLIGYKRRNITIFDSIMHQYEARTSNESAADSNELLEESGKEVLNRKSKE